ncbi:MAG: alpha/beta hydrolase [Thermodesulfobacteriota bacterium]
MSPENAAEGFLDAPGGKIHYYDWGGDGIPVHFLHANGFCAGVYAPMIRFLSPRLRVLATDVRGHGDSQGPELPIRRWNVFVKDLTLFIENRMMPPVVGVGHSLGAVITYMAAAERPDLFSKIILVDPVIFPQRLLFFWRLGKILGIPVPIPLAKGARRRKKSFSSRREALERFANGRGMFATWNREFVESYLSCALLTRDDETALLKCDPELEAQIYESVPTDAWSYARRIRCPALLVRGEHSDTFLPAAALPLSRRIPDARLAVIPGTGHFVPMEKPEDLARVILDFV